MKFDTESKSLKEEMLAKIALKKSGGSLPAERDLFLSTKNFNLEDVERLLDRSEDDIAMY